MLHVYNEQHARNTSCLTDNPLHTTLHLLQVMDSMARDERLTHQRGGSSAQSRPLISDLPL